jgi:hypothetical protein
MLPKPWKLRSLEGKGPFIFLNEKILRIFRVYWGKFLVRWNKRWTYSLYIILKFDKFGKIWGCWNSNK